MANFMRSVFATIGCGTAVFIVLVLAWMYREPLAAGYRAFVGETEAAAADTLPGVPGPDARRSAQRKHEAMADPDGPSSVRMSADEMASLIEDGLDPAAKDALDSLSVSLGTDRFVMEAQLMTEVWGRQALGPFGSFLQLREPIRVGGVGRIDRPGVLMWAPDEFAIRGIPFPGPAVTALVNTLTGGSDGAFWLALPATVGAVRIEPGGVTFFRREP